MKNRLLFALITLSILSSTGKTQSFNPANYNLAPVPTTATLNNGGSNPRITAMAVSGYGKWLFSIGATSWNCTIANNKLDHSAVSGEIDPEMVNIQAPTDNVLNVLSSPATHGSVTCFGGGLSTKVGPHATSVQSFDTSECDRLYEAVRAYNGVDAQKCYDTVRAYLTLCHDQPHSERAFGIAEGCAPQVHNSDPADEWNYLQWLKSVLYLRRDSLWYCSDVYSMLNTFSEYHGHVGAYYRGGLAVIKYVLDNNKCINSFDFGHEYTVLRNGDRKGWQDTVKDSLLTPYDTTLPTLESMDLGILRGPLAVSPSPSLERGGESLTGLRATENPFTNESKIFFTLNEYGLVTFELYDVLGRLRTGNGIGQVLYPGEHSFDIDGTKLDQGIYYARLTFHNGVTKSVMLRKE